MRIVCPRCVAQYEVDESSIPKSGREVQCANCENIWFQDYIEMLPTSVGEDIDTTEDEDRGVFDDLEGKSDSNFYSNRGAGPDDDEAEPSLDDDADDSDAPTDLTSDDLDDDFDEDDDAPATNIPVPPVDPDVLDVLRSEAAFSSARDQLDAAATDALDSEGEALKSALDDADLPTESTDDDVDSDVGDLMAFLDAHSAEDTKAPEPDDIAEDIEDGIAPDADATDTDFDPLADLNAIRSQLNDIGDSDSEATPEYTPNLPADDPIETPTDALDDVEETTFEEPNDVVDDIEDEVGEKAVDEDEPEYDDAFDSAALTAALDSGGQDRPELDDDFDDEKDDGPRHAYRADGITPPDESELDDPEPEQEDETDADLAAALKDEADEDAQDILDVDDSPQNDDSIAPTAAVAATAAAAVGMTRPRSKGSRTRTRTIPGFDAAPQRADPPADELSSAIVDAVQDAPKDIELDIKAEDLDAAIDTTGDTEPSSRQKTERKAMLPDVEELDASLRSDGDEPRRRDREMMDAHEGEQAQASTGGFRRAFIWTLFIIALLVALYVLRPQLVAALPAAAIVLDPYAAVIDSVRGLINAIFG